MKHVALSLVPALATLALAAPVAAQPSDGTAAAEQLFAEARSLVAQGDLAKACPKFEASLRLDPALGTRLNLADCYERAGKWTSAWGAFRAAADAARGAKDDRAEFAATRATELEKRLPKVVIRIVGAAPAGLVVTRDGAAVDAALFGAPVFVDPGPMKIVATAPERAERVIDAVAVEGKTIEVAVTLERTRTVRVVRDPGRSRRWLGLGVGAGGVTVALAGLGFGIAARGTWNAAYDDGLCVRTPLSCSPEGQDRVATAQRRAMIANVGVGVGAGLVVVGAIVYLTAPRRSYTDRPTLVPITGDRALGLGLSTSF